MIFAVALHRSATRSIFPFTTSTIAGVAAHYVYDYAGQDPVNGYDLDGAMMESENSTGVDLCQHRVCTSGDPSWNAASPSEVFKRVTGETPTQFLRAAGSFAGTCLSGMALGTPEGPAGTVGGCILAVGIRLARDSPNGTVREAGKWAGIVDEARNIQRMREILRDPRRAQQLLNDWRGLIRGATHR